MEVLLSSQISALLFAFLFGVAVGILYDLYRVLLVLFSLLTPKAAPSMPESLPLLPQKWLLRRSGRMGIRARAVLLFLCDTLFAMLAGGLFCVFLYAENDGIFRLYLLLGAVLTFSLYLLTVGKIVFRVAGFLSLYLHIFLLYLAYALTLPVRLLLLLCIGIWRRALAPFLSMLVTPLFRRWRFFVRRRCFRADLHAVLFLTEAGGKQQTP